MRHCVLSVGTACSRRRILRSIWSLKKQLERDEKRVSELKRLFVKIYEDNACGKRQQHIHIKYDGVGFIPLNMLRNEETA